MSLKYRSSSSESDSSELFEDSTAATENNSKTEASEEEEFPPTDEELESTKDESSLAQNSLFDNEAHSDENEGRSDIQTDNSDEEDEIIAPKGRRSIMRVNRILSDSEDEELDIKRRESIYKAEPEGDQSFMEENFSKVTRRSINGVSSRRSVYKSSSATETIAEVYSDSDSDVIVESDNEDNDANKENFNNSGSIEKKLSSTIRSPFKDNNIKDEKESFEDSITSKLSSTMHEQESKETSVSSSIEFVDLVGNNSREIKRISQSLFDTLSSELVTLKQRCATMNNLIQGNVKNEFTDGGKKLTAAIVKLKETIKEKEEFLKNSIVDKNSSIKNQIQRSFKAEQISIQSSMSDSSGVIVVPNEDNNINYLEAEDVKPKFTGKVGMKNFQNQKTITVEKLQDIQESINQRPADDVLAEQPKQIKLDLMKHQLHALAFMSWRETQKPRGGILADDMSLEKTLTIAAFILMHLYKDDGSDSDRESDDEEESEKMENAWVARGHKRFRNGGTLVICPATLMNQWENEIKSKVKKNALNVNVFHGPKRTTSAKELAKFDVVITTYQIIISEHKNDGCIFGMHWERIVLDEGHVIRNHLSKQSIAVCELVGKCRWVLTGTPIQNKEFDIYAAVKFLHCKPFDDIVYWRTFIEVRGNKGTSPRLATLLKSILLRRTKQQLMESGDIDSLPEKKYEEIYVSFNHEERRVYQKMLTLSQYIFANFLQQQQEKHGDYGTYQQDRIGKIFQKFKSSQIDGEISQVMILILLLRLRQFCCHPGLARQLLEEHDLLKDQETEDRDSSHDNSDIDVLNKLKALQLGPKEDAKENEFDDNSDVFNMDLPSSKIVKLMDVLREKLSADPGDKAIIVSQWVKYLNIIKGMLEVEGIEYCELNGSVPVKDRNAIVTSFNDKRSSTKIMLLSITSGGVGLNLVGANMLFIMDLHWNPQIEQQAQDRIYRFGQKKNVKIYKFICEDSIEEGILKKQQEKLDIATSTLTGAKRSASKLTLEDLKDLFGMNKC